MKILQTTGCATLIVGAALALAGCAAGPKKADDSAIALGKSLVMQSIPLGGLAVQALVSAGDGEDHGSYKYKSQLFCQTNLNALARMRASFAELCAAKRGHFDRQFSVRPDKVDGVLFSAQLEPQGTGDCYRLHVSEAVTVGSPDYLKFLV
ncbi:MAG TPA: hypothetical protein VEZ89_01750, partial [Rubrivivax sp.]|nr:hypothetical protein [Rubrivivax sp.]